jgi:hypothetical protein
LERENFRSVVQPFVLAMIDPWHDHPVGGGVRAEFVGYDRLRRTSLFAQEPRQQSPRNPGVPMDLHDFIEAMPWRIP